MGCIGRNPFFHTGTRQLLNSNPMAELWAQHSRIFHPGKTATRISPTGLPWNHKNYDVLGYSRGFVYGLQKSFKASAFLLLQRTVTTYLLGCGCKEADWSRGTEWTLLSLPPTCFEFLKKPSEHKKLLYFSKPYDKQKEKIKPDTINTFFPCVKSIIFLQLGQSRL